jgi:uridine kinase
MSAAGYMGGQVRIDNKPESIIFVGVTGGSCAGKSTFAQRLREALGVQYCQILYQDSYYRDQSARFDHDGGKVNFDEPSSIDFALLYEHLLQLQRGESIRVPIYDFATHRRLPETQPLFPSEVILLEGALILTEPRIRQLLTESVFLEADESVRLQRRIRRDTIERGRTLQGILDQFHHHVKPMHDRHIEPVKAVATYRVTDEATAQAAIADLVDKLGIDS